MRRICAVAIGVALLVATPGLATADTNTWTGTHQQAIDYVIQRGLSQRGVPYVYGGGNAAGPSRRPDPQPSAVPGANIIPGAITDPVANMDPAASTVGFDSSGLMVYAFAGVGIKLPRTSGQQYMVSRKVLPSQARPGDLIFFGPDGSQSVAMYLGNGQMLEATDPAVTVSPVRTGGMTSYLGRIIDP